MRWIAVVVMLAAGTARADESAEESRLEAIRADRKLMSAVFSAEFCVRTIHRDDALKEIAAEKKYGKIAGVVSMRKLYDLQQRIRKIDEGWAKSQGVMRKYYKDVRLLGCKDRLVLAVILCSVDQRAEEPRGLCATQQIRDMAGMVAMPEDDEEGASR